MPIPNQIHSRLFITAASLVPLLLMPMRANAQATTILHSFGDGTVVNDGTNPQAALTPGADGNFYGTTSQGGASSAGSIFQYNPLSGIETVLYSFGTIGDAAVPQAPMIQGSDGNLYGIGDGGAFDGGALFEYNLTTGVESVLCSFGDPSNPADALYPASGVIEAADGNFYGTTTAGGDFDAGTIYEYNTTTGVESVVYSFGDGCDGQGPQGALLQAKDGNFYGTTVAGGSAGYGAIYEFNTTTGVETVLYSFGAGSATTDGQYPISALIQATDGNFYGTTLYGGAQDVANGGDGTVFELNATTDAETVLYSFGKGATTYPVGPGIDAVGSTDGQNPVGPLTQGTDGNLYGTTANGGWGTVGTMFEYNMTTNKETVLHAFYDGTVANDGAYPVSSLLQIADGSFLGTALEGGAAFVGGAIYRFSPTQPQTPLVPPTDIYGLSVDSVAAGSATFNLWIFGDGFLPSSVIEVGSTKIKAYYGNPSILGIKVPASLVTTPGSITITVYNPTTPVSNASLTIYPASSTPTLSSLSQPYGLVGIQPTIGLSGLNFEQGCTVLVDSQICKATWIDSNDITLTIPASKMERPHTLSITVQNPSPGGTSAAASFLVIDLAPTTQAGIFGDQIGSTYIGAAIVQLTATPSTSSVAGTFYNLDGTGVQTYTGPFQVTTPGSHSLDYWSTDIFGSTEPKNNIKFTVAAVTLTSLTPNSAPTGPQPVIGLTGTNFVKGCSVLVNGTSYKATWNSSTHLTFTMPSSKMEKTHVLTVQVQNPFGETSNAQSFTVTN